ncbi:S1-like domain-containing RNA-binding protein [Tepidibacillus marianensis]|uniref:CvfB family protein n=1 Tax=Tepidibacillus marianensis TaxID=3131995 RepID=UPI0030CBCACB
MSLQAGTYQELTVERDSPFGFFLSNGQEDVLLHYAEMNQQEVKIGDKIKVFLYSDHKGRVAATLQKPKLLYGELGFLKVSGFQPTVGFFLDNGIGKEILLPISDLPNERILWPNTGDHLLVRITRDKQERLLAEFVVDQPYLLDEYLANQSFNRDNRAEQPLKNNQVVHGIVINHLREGTQVLLDNQQVGFIHRSEQINDLRLGEEVEARITFIREDGKVNLSLKPRKEVGRVEDADRILDFLKDRDGAMPYWDKTPADILMQKFHLSKAAFKRAIGKLMKEDLVYQEEGWTYLKNRHDL